MKKALSAILFVSMMIALLTVSAFSAYQSSRISVHVMAPIEGEIPSEVLEDNVVIEYISSAGTEKRVKDFVVETEWREKNNDLVAVTSFVAGREYKLRVRIILLNSADFQLETSTLVSVNGTLINNDADNERSQDADGVITLTHTFTATKRDITPSASIAISGEISKIFDGEATILTVKVDNRMTGLNYSYQWYRKEEKISNATEILPLRNVTDSGSYHCTVTATDGTREISVNTAEATVIITPRPVTIVIENTEKSVNEADPELKYTVQGSAFDPLVGALEREKGEGVGRFAIRIGTLTFQKEYISNYMISVTTGFLTVKEEGIITYTPVDQMADLSRIIGENSAKIKVQASKGSIPSDAMVSLGLAAANAGEVISSLTDGEVLKTFSASLINSASKIIPLANYSHVRFFIPLTAEEKSFLSQIKPVLFQENNNDLVWLDTETTEIGGASYLTFETSRFGTFALVKTAGSSSALSTDANGGSSSRSRALLWIMLGVSALAIGAIVYSVVWMQRHKNPTAPKKPKKRTATQDALGEDLLHNRLARQDEIQSAVDEINRMPLDGHLPPQNKNGESADEIPSRPKRGSSSKAKKNTAPQAEQAAEPSAKDEDTSVAEKAQEPDDGNTKKRRVVFFDDLED